MAERTSRAAERLAGLGVVPGARVLWSAPTSLDALVAAVAVLRVGAVLVPLNPAYTERELAHVVTDVRPALAVVGRPEQATWVQRAAPGTPVTDPALAATSLTAPLSASAPVLDRARPGDPAMVVYTSGTTGAPKGAVLTHANLAAGTRAIVGAWGWEPDDRLVLALPLFHVHGLCAGLFGTLTARASAVVLERFEAAAVLEQAAEGTMFFGVPTMYHRLVRQAGVRSLSRLRLCVSGSAPLAPALFADIEARAGVTVLERYGMSETLLTVSNPLHGERRAGTVGFPLPGVETRLVARPGGAAELAVRGPSVFAGYWERPAATAEVLSDGWFRTGDLASVDDDGYLAILGRAGDLIVSGGFNVYPAEVEDVLLGHPGVAEAAVAGLASAEWGEEVAAWVVPAAEGLTPAELLGYAAERLAPYKCPRTIHLVPQLPRNAMGKVLRNELR